MLAKKWPLDKRETKIWAVNCEKFNTKWIVSCEKKTIKHYLHIPFSHSKTPLHPSAWYNVCSDQLLFSPSTHSPTSVCFYRTQLLFTAVLPLLSYNIVMLLNDFLLIRHLIVLQLLKLTILFRYETHEGQNTTTLLTALFWFLYSSGIQDWIEMRCELHSPFSPCHQSVYFTLFSPSSHNHHKTPHPSRFRFAPRLSSKPDDWSALSIVHRPLVWHLYSDYKEDCKATRR